MYVPWSKFMPWLVRLLFLGIIFGGAFFLFYHQALCEEDYLSDLDGHLRYCEVLRTHTFDVPHPLFHFMVLAASWCSGLGLQSSAALVLACITTSLALIIFLILKASCREQTYGDGELLFVTFLLMTVSSVFIPGLVGNMYLGQGSPNVWHSATLLAVKPLAFLSVFLLFNREDKQKSGVFYAVIVSIVIVSIFAKPSFVFVLLPALWVFSAVKGKLVERPFLIFLFALSVSSFLAVALQFYIVYYGASVYTAERTTVVFDYLGVWSRYSNNVPISIVLGLAFPLAMLLADPRRVYRNDGLFLCWLMTCFGLLMASTLAETGPRYHHGNFMWSYRLTQNLVFVYSMAEFLTWDRNSPSRLWYGVILVALALHIISGMIYTVRIWSGGLYY